MNEDQRRYENFRAGAEVLDFPGTPLESMVAAEKAIDFVAENALQHLRAVMGGYGMSANASDAMHRLEAAMYRYVRESNPMAAEQFERVERFGQRAHDDTAGDPFDGYSD